MARGHSRNKINIISRLIIGSYESFYEYTESLRKAVFSMAELEKDRAIKNAFEKQKN